MRINLSIMSTKWYWVIHGMLTSERKASTLHFPIVIQQTLDPDARALKRQAPCRRLYMHTSTRQAQIASTRWGRRAIEVIICMITRDFSVISNDDTGVSLSLLLLTKVTDAQYRKRFRASYNKMSTFSSSNEVYFEMYCEPKDTF